MGRNRACAEYRPQGSAPEGLPEIDDLTAAGPAGAPDAPNASEALPTGGRHPGPSPYVGVAQVGPVCRDESRKDFDTCA